MEMKDPMTTLWQKLTASPQTSQQLKAEIEGVEAQIEQFDTQLESIEAQLIEVWGDDKQTTKLLSEQASILGKAQTAQGVLERLQNLYREAVASEAVEAAKEAQIGLTEARRGMTAIQQRRKDLEQAIRDIDHKELPEARRIEAVYQSRIAQLQQQSGLEPQDFEKRLRG